MKPYKVLAFFH